MTLKEIQLKLYQKLVPSGWGDKLKMFLLSDDFGKILTELKERVDDDKRFTPVLKDLFTAFEKCNYADLKVVFIGSAPYPQPEIADGMAFSCSKSAKPEPALRVMFQDLENTIYPDGMPWDADLTRWANQGVLLLNPSLTCDLNTGQTHQDIWIPFITALFDMLSTYNTGLAFVFMGKKAKGWHKSVASNNYKFFTTHPASAAYSWKQKWDSGNMFANVNKVLYNNNGEQITW
jgi:uracil-DNA glycosylase